MTYLELTGAEVLERACASTATVLAAVCAADLDLPTPCRSWTVKDVINHVIGSAASYAELAETGVMPAGGRDADHTAGDFGATFARQAGRVVSAFSVPGAMDTIMEMPFGGDARFGLRVDRGRRHLHPRLGSGQGYRPA